MDRYAVIDGAGNVVNLVVWDGEDSWAPPVGCTAVLDTGGAVIGGTYVGGRFLPPTGG